MAASRHTSPGVQTALTWLSDGTCYWPGCPERVVRLIDGEYKLALQVAHICGVSPGGPRYDPTMSDASRNDFANLLLLCYVHHKTIDGTGWQQYSVTMLKAWKSEREAAKGSALQTLRDITEDRMQVLIATAIASRDDEIKQTLSRLEKNDTQAASLLRELTDELTELRGRGSLLDPDTVGVIDSAANRLGHLQDTAGWLDGVADKLGHLQDTAGWLDGVADKLGHLQDTASWLNEAAQRMERAAEQMTGLRGRHLLMLKCQDRVARDSARDHPTVGGPLGRGTDHQIRRDLHDHVPPGQTADDLLRWCSLVRAALQLYALP